MARVGGPFTASPLVEVAAAKLKGYRVRNCYTLHACALCEVDIRPGDQYHDGGYGRRAHVACVERALGGERG